ncbi:MAG: TraR/DksA C4-type zinc finger protein [Dehalococcoidales bacterium]
MKEEGKTASYNLAKKKKLFLRELKLLKSAQGSGNKRFDGSLARERTEIADAATEFEKNLALGMQKQTNLELIERALSKIDEGSYGICDICGKSINPARMAILPYANLCIKCCNDSSR